MTKFKWSATTEYPFPRGKLVNWYKRALSCAEISEKQMNLIINGAKRKFDNQLILVWAVLANRNTWSVICLHNFWGVNECTLHRSVHGSIEFEKYGHYLNTVNLGIRYRNKWARKSCLYRPRSMHTFIGCNIMFMVLDNSCAFIRKFRLCCIYLVKGALCGRTWRLSTWFNDDLFLEIYQLLWPHQNVAASSTVWDSGHTCSV